MSHAFQSLMVGASLLFVSIPCAAVDITLENGSRLTVNDIEYNRMLPYTFYDQAISSLPRLFPGYELLASRRSGMLGEVIYAMVCYRETPSSEDVVIQIVAVFKDRAWALNAVSPVPYGDTLVQVLEYTGKLATNP